MAADYRGSFVAGLFVVSDLETDHSADVFITLIHDVHIVPHGTFDAF